MELNAYELIDILKKTYPEAKCSLDFNTPFELLVAVMLSAQCTDERVNKTLKCVFPKYNKPEDFANMDINELEKFIRPCGFYKNKAKNLKSCSQKLIDNFNSTVPNNMDDLLTLPGIGRKSANVILLDAFGTPVGIAVDTHCKRVSLRLGLSLESDPEKVEKDLLNFFPKELLKDVNHLFVWHGRNICTARSSKCSICPINKYCKNWNN